jgi:type IV secretion system protein VirB11
MALAIRKHVVNDLSLDDYVRSGAFDEMRRTTLQDRSAVDQALTAVLEQGRVTDFLRMAVKARKNIIVSGGTSTGKTTFLNALVKEIPDDERLIVIEDAAEVRLERDNAVGLIAVRGELGQANVTVDQLLQASLRLRPDRIILGELRGQEAYSFLRAVNSGHPGSITTVHADNPRAAIDQIALMVLHAGVNLGLKDVADYVASTVEVAVQLSRTAGRRLVSECVFNPRG